MVYTKSWEKLLTSTKLKIRKQKKLRTASTSANGPSQPSSQSIFDHFQRRKLSDFFSYCSVLYIASLLSLYFHKHKQINHQRESGKESEKDSWLPCKLQIFCSLLNLHLVIPPQKIELMLLFLYQNFQQSVSHL